jgi:hypothetical protein
MAGRGKWKKRMQGKIVDEATFIKKAFRDARPPYRKIIKVVPAQGGIGFMYAEGEILVREEYLERVLAILGQPNLRRLQQRGPDLVPQVITGVRLLTLGGQFPTVLRARGRTGALERIDQLIGPGVATPNHVLTVAGGTGSHCPATEPEEVYDDIEPYPSVCQANGGAGVLVYMVDTGLLREVRSRSWKATHRWLASGVRMGDPARDKDPRKKLRGSPPRIPPYAGHGTFVAGVTRCMAPSAEIIVTNVPVTGSALESDLVPRLEAALSLGVDIFHLTIACQSRLDFPLIAFQEWLRRLSQYQGAVCVVAAGNSGVRRPAWPAAFHDVIAVGALGGDWRGRASFSNFGPWVDVYAPGRDLINAYATGRYKCHIAPYKGQVRNFSGMAKWSGTSFSTPIVTGLIASRMSRTGESAKHAAAALLAEARDQAIPGVGPILLPCCGPRHEPPATCGGCGCCDHHHRC